MNTQRLFLNSMRFVSLFVGFYLFMIVGVNAQRESTAGFTTISYLSADLSKILDNSESVYVVSGLDGRNIVLMAIGLDADGNRIGKKYVQSDVNSVTSVIGRVKMRKQRKALLETPLAQGTFATEVLQEILEESGNVGIGFQPTAATDSSGNPVVTLSAGGLSTSGDLNDRMVPGSPCPPDCGGDN